MRENSLFLKICPFLVKKILKLKAKHFNQCYSCQCKCQHFLIQILMYGDMFNGPEFLWDMNIQLSSIWPLEKPANRRKWWNLFEMLLMDDLNPLCCKVCFMHHQWKDWYLYKETFVWAVDLISKPELAHENGKSMQFTIITRLWYFSTDWKDF